MSVKKRALLVSSLLALAGASVVFLAWGGWPKAKPFVDSDLIPDWVQAPLEHNAFLTLSQATNELYWPEASWDTLDAMCSDRSWDDSLASEVLQKNHACLAWFDKSFEWGLVFPPGRLGREEEFAYLGSLKQIGQLECLWTAKLCHDGKQQEAFDLALKVVEFGHRLENSGGAGMHFLVGTAIKAQGLRRLRLMTAQTSLPEAELVRLIKALAKLGANEAGLTNALKAEYQIQCHVLDDLAAAKFQSLGIANSPSARMVASNQIRQVFSADKTRAKFAQTTRALLVDIPAPFSRAEWPQYSHVKTVGKAWLERAVVGKHNGSGDLVYYMQMPAFKRLFERKSRENVEVRATQLLLALKIFAKRHKHLPPTLTELTPEFFRRVPLDDFDGKPMRYLPETKLIYSVGPDLKDSQGKKTRGADHLAFEILF